MQSRLKKLNNKGYKKA